MGVAEQALLMQEPAVSLAEPDAAAAAAQYDEGAGQADVGVTEAQAEERQECCLGERGVGGSVILRQENEGGLFSSVWCVYMCVCVCGWMDRWAMGMDKVGWNGLTAQSGAPSHHWVAPTPPARIAIVRALILVCVVTVLAVVI